MTSDLHHRQLEEQKAQNRDSARRILGILFEYFVPRSILDVGCGLGAWLAVARDLGIQDVHGMEGQWVDPSQLEIDRSLVSIGDLEQGISAGRRFDLVICLEVAEHLDAQVADRLVASLCQHAPAVLFSAAIPYQGGHHHVNKQFRDYWAVRFAQLGYRALDVIRGPVHCRS